MSTDEPSEPRAWMADRLATDYRGGAWTESPWFCEEEDDWFSRAGYPLARRQHLVKALSLLYPAIVCRQLLMTPGEAGLVLGLFERWPGFLIPALDVASNLDVVPWATKSSVVNGLRRHESFAASAAELGVWADLVRAGYTVDREPPVATKDSIARPDFGVVVGSDYCIVEVTALLPSAQKRVARLLEEEVFVGPSHLILDGCLVRLRPSEEFLSRVLPRLVGLMETDSPEARERVRSIVRAEVAPSIGIGYATANAEGSRPGLYEAPGVGFLEVSNGATAVECELVPELPPSAVAKRLVTKIIEKARQLQDGRRRLRRGVVVVEVGWASSIMPLVKEVTSVLQPAPDLRHIDRLDRVDAILLRGSWKRPDGVWETATHAITLHRAPDTGMRRLFYALGGGYMVRMTHGQERIVGRGGQQIELGG